MEKHSVLRLSYLFSHLHLLSSYSFSSTLLSSNLSLLSASSLLCFSSVHIVGSLTSKLPSTIPQMDNLGKIGENAPLLAPLKQTLFLLRAPGPTAPLRRPRPCCVLLRILSNAEDVLLRPSRQVLSFSPMTRNFSLQLGSTALVASPFLQGDLP